MSVAQWISLFVTADVPVEVSLIRPAASSKSTLLTLIQQVINTVLENAGKESRESDDTFRNPWILIQQPDQQTIDSKPTAAPLSKLSAKFVDFTSEQLQAFVEATFGDDGLGHNDNEHNDFLANDAFGVIDARTKQDGSIAFFAQTTSLSC